MPEGHTLHRLARLHTEHFAGGPVLVSSPQGRFGDSVLVSGRVFELAEAVGKHLFHHYEGGAIVHVHLGLYGFFREELVGRVPPEPVGQVRMRMLGAESSSATAGRRWMADLRGPTRCEVLDGAGRAAIVARLGPDPLDPGADQAPAFARISRSSRPIGALLMDQAVFSGVGNVYRAEVLFRLGVDPFRPGRAMHADELSAIWAELVALMPLGVDTGGIVTIRPAHDHGDVPRRGSDRPRNYVYQRDGWGCRVCSDYVQVTEVEGRSMYWCPTCQAGSPRSTSRR